jgi:hypothetical protein
MSEYHDEDDPMVQCHEVDDVDDCAKCSEDPMEVLRELKQEGRKTVGLCQKCMRELQAFHFAAKALEAMGLSPDKVEEALDAIGPQGPNTGITIRGLAEDGSEVTTGVGAGYIDGEPIVERMKAEVTRTEVKDDCDNCCQTVANLKAKIIEGDFKFVLCKDCFSNQEAMENFTRMLCKAVVK